MSAVAVLGIYSLVCGVIVLRILYKIHKGVQDGSFFRRSLPAKAAIVLGSSLFCQAFIGTVIIPRDVFTQEVDLTTVPVQGEKRFLAKVEMVYADGKLSAVNLVPDSTTEAPKLEANLPPIKPKPEPRNE